MEALLEFRVAQQPILQRARSTSRLWPILPITPTRIAQVESLSGRHGGHQLGEPDDIQHPAEIVGERGQAELTTDLLQTTHQKRSLVHPLFDRAKRVLNRLTTPVENTRVPGKPDGHPVQDGFVLET
jgi:hypothetical protein